jgi:glycosyltransferase involved in cell wall biosynthesis
MGPVPLAQMPDRYREMDILLLPTVREGCSMSVLEAMACGLPVVASNCSSLPEQIEDGKGGYLCPVGDVEAFAEKINLLAASSRMRREMGDYNRDRAETKFTIDRMIAGYQSVFNEVIKHHS